MVKVKKLDCINFKFIFTLYFCLTLLWQISNVLFMLIQNLLIIFDFSTIPCKCTPSNDKLIVLGNPSSRQISYRTQTNPKASPSPRKRFLMLSLSIKEFNTRLLSIQHITTSEDQASRCNNTKSIFNYSITVFHTAWKISRVPPTNIWRKRQSPCSNHILKAPFL